MIYYPRYVLDMARGTVHLSLMERGALNALLDHYYAVDGDMPESSAALCRIAGAQGEDECRAVSRVADEFFPVVDGKRSNERADREIAKYRARAAGGKRRSETMTPLERSLVAQRAANARWFREG